MRQNRFLAMLLFATLSCAAQSMRSAKAYDNFNHKFLDPSRWDSVPACYAGAGLEMECVRALEDGRLHLAHRTLGQRDSDTGLQVGIAQVDFVNSASIKSITADVVVRNVVEVPCAVNTGFGGNATIWGVFFNAGGGDSSDDVGAQVVVGRLASDPPGQLTLNTQIFHNGDYSIDYQTIGTVPFGTPVTATLTWDPPNHQFLVSWTNRTTHVTTATTLPYSFSDATPAASPGKVLEVVGFPANCTANPTYVYVDALFDNVYITH
jgi:hypothetical protein